MKKYALKNFGRENEEVSEFHVKVALDLEAFGSRTRSRNKKM